MELDMFIIADFCRMDDALKILFQEKPLRQRGPAPVLSDAEVLIMEVVNRIMAFRTGSPPNIRSYKTCRPLKELHATSQAK